jgi:hypothetical protein
MHHDAGVVHQHPAGLSRAFAAARLGVTGDKHVLFDSVGDGLQLPFTGAGAHDEIIHVRRQLAQIEQDNVFAQLVLNGLDDVVSEF